MKCNVYWGSHGCDLESGNDHEHLCASCCNDGLLHRERHKTAPDGYGFEGCAGAWPYYGSKHMAGKTEHGLGFFTYYAPNWEFIYLPNEFDRMAELHNRETVRK